MHTAGNLGLTNFSSQFAKFTFLPGTLAEISNFLNLNEPTIEEEVLLLDHLDGLHRLRLRIPYSKADRTKGKSNEALLE